MTEAKPEGKPRAFLVNASLAIGSVTVLALLCELLLTFAAPIVYRARVTRVDPTLGWTHNPSSVSDEIEGHPITVTYNQHGYRGPEHNYEKPEGMQRVIVLGDSFVDGDAVGDDEVFTAHLQDAIPSAEIINLGVYGYSTAQELLTLQEVGTRYGPDLVVLVTISNDFTGNTRNFYSFGPVPRFRLAADSLVFEPADGPTAYKTFKQTNLPAPFMRTLHRRSMVYYMLNRHVFQRFASGRITALLNEQADAVSVEDRRELYRRIVVRIDDVAREAGADFLLVFGYMRYEIEENTTSPNSQIAARLSSDGVAVLDLFDAFQEAKRSSEEPLWYAEDIHWNPLGHRVVADLLAPPVSAVLATRGDRN